MALADRRVILRRHLGQAADVPLDRVAGVRGEKVFGAKVVGGRDVGEVGFFAAEPAGWVRALRQGCEARHRLISSVDLDPHRWRISRPGRSFHMATEEELKAELERLKKENESLKARTSKGVSLKVSEKGGVSVYGLGRFPVTLYKEQWTKLLDMADDIRRFIQENESKLKAKE